MRALAILLFLAAPLSAAEIVIPVATGETAGRQTVTAVTISNSGTTQVRCALAVPRIHRTFEQTLEPRTVLAIDRFLPGYEGMAAVRVECSSPVDVGSRIEGFVHGTFSGRVADGGLAGGASRTESAGSSLALMEVGGHPVDVQLTWSSGDVAPKRYTIGADGVQFINPRDAETVVIGVAGGKGRIVIARDSGASSSMRNALVAGNAAAQPPHPARLLLMSSFKAAPFLEPMTGLVYMRERWYDPRTGTFVSGDPMGYRDSSNLYSYCGGDPVNCSDPTGMYEADVHYGLTRFLAEAAGFEKIDAEIIANETVGVDIHDATSPTFNAAKGNWPVVYEYHFPIGPNGKVEEGIDWATNPRAWGKIRAARDLVDFGMGLHLLQDSFSHAGAYAGNIMNKRRVVTGGRLMLPIAQALGQVRRPGEGITHDFTAEHIERFDVEGGFHAVDWTFMDPEKLRRAAKATFDAMVDYRLSHHEISPVKAAALRAKWLLLVGAIDSFAAESTVEGKKAWIRANVPDGLTKLPWGDLSLGLAKGK